MAITTILGYANAPKQIVHINKAASTAAVNGVLGDAWYDAAAGSDPAVAGAFVLSSTAAGTVPTSATAGAPAILTFSGIGYISRISWETSGIGSGTAWLLDRLFECGSYAIGSGTTTLGSQPSFSARVPGGDYTGLRLFLEQSSAGAGPTSVTITYTDQDGNAGASTTYTLLSNGGSNAGTTCQRIPLAAGDSGLQKIESVTMTGGASGSLNFLVCRELARLTFNGIGATTFGPGQFVHGIEKCGMRQIYSDSCLMLVGNVSNGAGFADLTIEIASG